MQIEISGIKIELQKKNIKNLHLVVAPPDGKVRVSAPTVAHLSSPKPSSAPNAALSNKSGEALATLTPHSATAGCICAYAGETAVDAV